MIEYKGEIDSLDKKLWRDYQIGDQNMSTINTIYDRHSVRQYHNQPLREEVIHVLR